ncbi:hypothetical protein GCM10027174_04010 [Salinifilum aidingensis]
MAAVSGIGTSCAGPIPRHRAGRWQWTGNGNAPAWWGWLARPRRSCPDQRARALPGQGGEVPVFILGSPAFGAALAARTRGDELAIMTETWDLEDRIRSCDVLAEAWRG